MLVEKEFANGYYNSSGNLNPAKPYYLRLFNNLVFEWFGVLI
jgi:hypothetical protein